MSLYEELEVSNIASAETIAAAFKSLSKRFHPDVCSLPTAKDRYSRITNAYNVLSDPQKRKEYDEQLLFEAMQQGYAKGQAQGANASAGNAGSEPGIDQHIETVSSLSLKLIEAHVISRIPPAYQAAYPMFQLDIENLIKTGIRRMVQ